MLDVVLPCSMIRTQLQSMMASLSTGSSIMIHRIVTVANFIMKSEIQTEETAQKVLTSRCCQFMSIGVFGIGQRLQLAVDTIYGKVPENFDVRLKWDLLSATDDSRVFRICSKAQAFHFNSGKIHLSSGNGR